MIHEISINNFLLLDIVNHPLWYNTNNVLTSRAVQIDSSLSITKFSDGRVAPVANASSLSSAQIDNVLRQMNVSEDEISMFAREFKEQLVAKGGVEVHLETKATQTYHSLDGKKYVITPENKEEVAAIQARDQATIAEQGKSTGAMTASDSMGSASDGIWSAHASLFFAGKSSNGYEYVYDYYNYYSWSDYPQNVLWDSIAQSWGANISSANSSGANNYLTGIVGSGPYTQAPMTITRKIGGTKGDFDLVTSYHQYGALHDELRIPLAQKGTNQQLTAGYAHPYIGGIVAVALTYLGIDWASFTGNEWDWDSSFTVSTL